jgi:hypothetical protein
MPRLAKVVLLSVFIVLVLLAVISRYLPPSSTFTSTLEPSAEYPSVAERRSAEPTRLAMTHR